MLDHRTNFFLASLPSPQARLVGFIFINKPSSPVGFRWQRQKHVLWSFTYLFLLSIILLRNSFADPAPFAPGEIIHYNITQLGLKAGEATLEFKGPARINGQKTLLIVFTSNGLNFYDKERIYVDPQTYKPLVVERDLDIFGKKEKIIEEYSSRNGKVKITKMAGGRQKTQELQKPGEIDNIYGFIYGYRMKGSFAIGDELSLRLPTKDIKITLHRQEKLSQEGKQMDSFYMQSKPAQYKIWFDTSAKKMPLRISGSIGLANTAMVMTDAKD